MGDKWQHSALHELEWTERQTQAWDGQRSGYTYWHRGTERCVWLLIRPSFSSLATGIIQHPQAMPEQTAHLVAESRWHRIFSGQTDRRNKRHGSLAELCRFLLSNQLSAAVMRGSEEREPGGIPPTICLPRTQSESPVSQWKYDECGMESLLDLGVFYFENQRGSLLEIQANKD